MSDGQVTLAHDHLVIDFPYDAEQVAEIKRIAGARWDKVSRVWRAPVASLAAVRGFAERHGFAIDDDLHTFRLPPRPDADAGVRRMGEYVILDFGFDPVKVRLVKSIPGVTWHAESKAWRAPLTSLDAAIAWADRFDLDVPGELRAEAAQRSESRAERIAASRGTDAEITVPGLSGQLFGYQRAGIAYAADSRRCFLADDMGLGKTVQAIGALEYAHAERPSYPAVVVCPPKLALNWRAEYERWLPGRRVAVVTDRKTWPEADYDVVVLGWSNLAHWAERAKRHAAYVLDESHAAKNPQSQRSKAAVKIVRSAPEAMVLCLTGTPITNRPAEYAPQLQILGALDRFGGLHGFWRSYCNAFRDRWGHWHTDGASNLDELNERLRGEGLYIRRTKDQVLTELPPVLHDPVVVEGDVAAMREYARAEADIVAWLVERARQLAAEMGTSPGAAAVRARMAAESHEHLVRMSVLRRLAARAKMDLVNDWVTERIESGRKVVLAAHHRDVVDELAARFGGLKIQGGQTVAEVEAHKARFQTEPADAAPVIVLSIQAAKEGHTLTASQDVCFVELPWTPADVDQTYARCHRIGQTGSVTVTYLLAAGTVDLDIHDTISAKRQVVTAAVEGGVATEVDLAASLVGKYLQLGFDQDATRPRLTR